MSSRERIYPEISRQQSTKVSRYFRFLTKISVFPVKIDSEKEIVSFRFCSLKFIVFFLFCNMAFFSQLVGIALSFDLDQYMNETARLFHDGALTDNLSILSFLLIWFLVGFSLFIFFMNMGR